jgi:rhamnosyltransferase subunit B
MYRAAGVHPQVLAKINATRAQVGLAPVQSAGFGRRHVVAEAAMFPDWYGMPAEDWPALQLLGFPLPVPKEPLPAPVQEFLTRNPRPLVFTTGTGCATPARFFEAAARCCAALGMPGVFLSRFLEVESGALGDRIAHFHHVELGALLPHAALMIHHGGMGTTARGLEAGIPQVVSPMVFDQPDNGHRLELLGVGRVVSREHMSGATFAAAARELLSDPEIQTRLSRYRTAIATQDAIADAADLLQNVASSTPLLAPSAVSTPAAAE